jgi:predicted RNase H-like HicB family nuclease
MKLRIVIDECDSTFGAHVPDLPGCVAVGRTLEEVQLLIKEAIEAHVALLREQGLPVPEPSHE